MFCTIRDSNSSCYDTIFLKFIYAKICDSLYMPDNISMYAKTTRGRKQTNLNWNIDFTLGHFVKCFWKRYIFMYVRIKIKRLGKFSHNNRKLDWSVSTSTFIHHQKITKITRENQFIHKSWHNILNFALSPLR